MRRLVVSLVVLAAFGVALDFGARNWAEAQIESRAKAELSSHVGTAAHIRGFPFVPPLLFGGRVAEADGHFTNVPAGVVTLSVVDIELHGVRVNRDKLVHDRKVELKSISSGTVSAELTAPILEKVLGGARITIADGTVTVTFGGANFTARLSVVKNQLVIAAGALSRAITLNTSLVPCVGAVTVLAGRVRLTCTIHNVPPALLGAANARG